MKVKELITELSKYPEDMVVAVDEIGFDISISLKVNTIGVSRRFSCSEQFITDGGLCKAEKRLCIYFNRGDYK